MQKSPYIKIGNRKIGKDFKPIIIAELGINHGGCIDRAIQMVDSAISVGAEIIKHQTHIIEDEMSNEAKFIVPGNAKESIYKIMKKCSLTEKDEKRLMQHVKSKKTLFISTPFSKAAVDRLVKFKVPAFKIGSGECNNYPLIEYICQFKKPLIISTGMNDINCVKKTVSIIKKKNIPYALLHCTNIYPTPHKLVRLDAINLLQKTFPDAVIGLSDHTIDNISAYGGLALGCSIIERHFTDNKKRSGPDIICSMTTKDLKELISASEKLFLARGSHKGPLEEEKQTIKFAFSSVVSTKDIYPGEKISKKNIWLKRPSTGDYGPDDYEKLIGKKVYKLVKKGSQIKIEHFKK